MVTFQGSPPLAAGGAIPRTGQGLKLGQHAIHRHWPNPSGSITRCRMGWCRRLPAAVQHPVWCRGRYRDKSPCGGKTPFQDKVLVCLRPRPAAFFPVKRKAAKATAILDEQANQVIAPFPKEMIDVCHLLFDADCGRTIVRCEIRRCLTWRGLLASATRPPTAF